MANRLKTIELTQSQSSDDAESIEQPTVSEQPKVATSNGRKIHLVPIYQIETSTVPRSSRQREAIDRLAKQFRETVLSKPIEVEMGLNGKLRVLNGEDAVAAARMLYAKTGDTRWAKIPATFVPSVPDLGLVYRRELERRASQPDATYSELAQVVIDYARDPFSAVSRPQDAIPLLFESANRTECRNLGAFVQLLDQLGHCLRFPRAISLGLGLALVEKMNRYEGLSDEVTRQLSCWPERAAQDELNVLRIYSQFPEGSATFIRPNET